MNISEKLPESPASSDRQKNSIVQFCSLWIRQVLSAGMEAEGTGDKGEAIARSLYDLSPHKALFLRLYQKEKAVVPGFAWQMRSG